MAMAWCTDDGSTIRQDIYITDILFFEKSSARLGSTQTQSVLPIFEMINKILIIIDTKNHANGIFTNKLIFT